MHPRPFLVRLCGAAVVAVRDGRTVAVGSGQSSWLASQRRDIPTPSNGISSVPGRLSPPRQGPLRLITDGHSTDLGVHRMRGGPNGSCETVGLRTSPVAFFLEESEPVRPLGGMCRATGGTDVDLALTGEHPHVPELRRGGLLPTMPHPTTRVALDAGEGAYRRGGFCRGHHSALFRSRRRSRAVFS